ICVSIPRADALGYFLPPPFGGSFGYPSRPLLVPPRAGLGDSFGLLFPGRRCALPRADLLSLFEAGGRENSRSHPGVLSPIRPRAKVRSTVDMHKTPPRRDTIMKHFRTMSFGPAVISLAIALAGVAGAAQPETPAPKTP